MITVNLIRYAAVCNVDPQDMVRAIQRDPFQRAQFEAWKRDGA
jgi:hypothetical protein